MRPPPSLRAQAITWLAQREHSERELRAKLQRRVITLQRRAQMAASGNDRQDAIGAPQGAGDAAPRAAAAGAATDPAADRARVAAEIDELMAWLVARGYLDEQRFVASRVHVRAERFGVARIEQELSRHGLDLPADAVATLRSSEFERARSLWERRFGAPPADLREAARQARFLSSRGFAGDVIRRVVPRWRVDHDADDGHG